MYVTLKICQIDLNWKVEICPVGTEMYISVNYESTNIVKGLDENLVIGNFHLTLSDSLLCVRDQTQATYCYTSTVKHDD